MKAQINGKRGEDAACKFLKKNHYAILERNYRKRCGEIDIIAQKDETIIFVEVKTRADVSYGTPAEFVTYEKQQKIIKTAQTYVVEQGLDAAYSFDVIEVFLTGNKVSRINHIENAFYI